MHSGAPIIPDIHNSVLAAVGLLDHATEREVADALSLHPHFAPLNEGARLVEAEHWLGTLRSNGWACQSWKDKWKLTQRGMSRFKAKPCDRCTSRGWCTCHD